MVASINIPSGARINNGKKSKGVMASAKAASLFINKDNNIIKEDIFNNLSFTKILFVIDIFSSLL